MTHLFLDIESRPCEEGSTEYALFSEAFDKKLDNIKAPSNYGEEAAKKFVDKKRAEAVEEKEEARRKTALDGRYGSVLAIGYSFDGDDEKCIIGGDENEIFGQFLDVCLTNLSRITSSGTRTRKSVTVVGHNVKDFDLRFLFQRAVVCGFAGEFARTGVIKSSYKHGEIYDTMTEFAGYRGTISLDALCQLTGIGGKGDITGADVYDLWLAGELDRIANYCQDDVSKVIQLWSLMGNKLT